MTDVYEFLVKEYLELKGYLVRTRIQFRKVRNWSDIDILGVKVKDGKVVHLIVGEVKGESQNKKEVKSINEHLEHPKLKDKLKELFGNTNYEKWLYCWSIEQQIKDFAETLGIKTLGFVDIVKYLLEKVKKHRGWFYEEYPNLMLLQFMHQKKGQFDL